MSCLPNTNRGVGERLDRLVFGEATPAFLPQASSTIE